MWEMVNKMWRREMGSLGWSNDGKVVVEKLEMSKDTSEVINMQISMKKGKKIFQWLMSPSDKSIE